MDAYAVMGQIGAAVDTIAGLRTSPWGAKRADLPAAIVTLPDTIEYLETYKAGAAKLVDIAIVVIVGQATQRTAARQLLAYCAGSGAKSIRAAVESYAFTAASAVTVKRCEFRPVTFGGVDYDIAATFFLDAYGTGG